MRKTMKNTTVYSMTCCPRCEILKEYLKGCQIPFKEADMEDAAAITELRLEGCFAYEAPVLQVEEPDGSFTFLESGQMFPDGKLATASVPKTITG